MPEEETAKQKLSGDICLLHNEYIVTVVTSIFNLPFQTIQAYFAMIQQTEAK